MKKIIQKLDLRIICCLFVCSFFYSCQKKSNDSNTISAQEVENIPTTNDAWIDKNESEDYVARHECSFVQAGDKFIMFGGRESAQQLDIYDYKTNTWSTGSSAPKEFNHFQATAHKGFIWVIGSFKTNDFPREIPEENVWLYYPPSDIWIKGPEIPEDRRRGGAGLAIYNDKFYVVGGNTIGHDGGYVNWFDLYDPKENTWTELVGASQQRDHFSAAVIGNTLYAAGGRRSGGEQGVFSPIPTIVDIYNFDTKSWSILSKDLPTPRAAPGVAVLNGELLLMGGEGEEKGPAYKLVEAYNPSTGTWSRKADMHYARHGTQAILSGKGIYIAAGSPTRGGGRQWNMEVYGEDSPAGEILTSSRLETQSLVSIPTESSKVISIQNTGGNTGSFISSAEVIGAGSSQFQIDSKLAFILVDANEKISIKIQHTGKAGDNAQLKIVYNGDVESVVDLISE